MYLSLKVFWASWSCPAKQGVNFHARSEFCFLTLAGGVLAMALWLYTAWDCREAPK